MKNDIRIVFALAAIISVLISSCAQPAEEKPAVAFQEVIDTGVLAVESAPSEAQVYVDDEFKGITPLTLYNFPVGEYTVLVKKDGYSDFEKSVAVKVGLTEEVDANLDLVKNEVIEPKPEAVEMPQEQAKAESNKINLSSFAMYYDFENKLFTSIRSEKSDLFSRKYADYIQFTSITPAKIKIIKAPLKDVSMADCLNPGAVGQLYSGQTLCVITVEGNYFAVSGAWDKAPTELEFVQLS